MKLIAVSLCVFCGVVFSQDATQVATPQEKEIVDMIVRHEPIRLPGAPLGSNAQITALGLKKDASGIFIKLVGVKITTADLLIEADELSYPWATGYIELSGRVRVKSASGPTP